nr:MAG: replication polyprotein [Chemarfal virus 13]
MPAPYRLQGAHISLTYPRCDAPLDDLLTYLRNKSVGSRSPKHVIVCSETHEDGTFHRHAYVNYDGRINITNPRNFDFGSFHPNIQSCRNVEAWKNYVKKDGTFVEWQSDIEEVDIVTLAGRLSRREFMNYAVAHKLPFGYYQEAIAQANNESDLVTFNEDPNSNFAYAFEKPLHEYEFSTDKTNVIVGPTGCGKTLKCLREMKKPVLMVSHIDQLKLLGLHHKSILFDDMNFSHLPLQAQIHMVDRSYSRAIHRRYGTTVIPLGTQVAITCNELPFMYHPAIARRTHQLVIPDI